MKSRRILDDLPIELITLILDRDVLVQDFPKLKELRYVSRKFAQAGAVVVFKNVHMGMFSDSIDRVRKISQSQLGRHVRNVVLHAEKMHPFTQQSAYGLKPYPDTWAACTGLKNKSEPELLDAWMRYEHYRKDQESIRDSYSIFLTESWPMFTGLKELTVYHQDRTHCNMNAQPIWRRMIREIYVGPADWARVAASVQLVDVQLHRLVSGQPHLHSLVACTDSASRWESKDSALFGQSVEVKPNPLEPTHLNS